MTGTRTEAYPRARVAGMRTFAHVLVNTVAAHVTTSYIFFGLSFWVYLETRSVLAPGVIGGVYMLMASVVGVVFGSIVDRYRKHRVMVFATAFALAAFLLAGVVYLSTPADALLDLDAPMFWIFAGLVLLGSMGKSMRSIALSATVTLLVPEARRANANGLVGTVQGLAFIVTGVFSGLSIGLVGMGWTLLVAAAVTAGTLGHLLLLRIPEARPETDGEVVPMLDVRGGIAAIRSVPGLGGFVTFGAFNSLVGGVFLALMDPYGIDLLSVELWGLVLSLSSTGVIVGGLVVARAGVGRRPVRMILVSVAVMGMLLTPSRSATGGGSMRRASGSTWRSRRSSRRPSRP